MRDQLELTPRVTRYGCGIYEAGDTERCYVKLFITDTGRVIPVNHRVISDEDLMDAYVWGREDAEEFARRKVEDSA